MNDLLEIGQQGLSAHRQGLSTVSNNIANAANPQHSRERVELKSIERQGNGNARIGGGVEVKSVIRIHDSFVQDQIVEEAKHLGGLRIKSESLARVESLFHPGNGDIGESLNTFFESIRDLSSNPEQLTTRNAVKETGLNLTKGMRKLNEDLTTFKREMDQRLEGVAADVSQTAAEIAHLNHSIVIDQQMGNSPNELLDRRDFLLRQLSEKVEFQSVLDGQGNINVVLGGAGHLVFGDEASSLVVTPTGQRSGRAVGNADVFLKDKTGMKLATPSITEGEMGALIQVRDKVLDTALDRLDVLAFNLTQRFNETHREGVGRDGIGGRSFFNDLEGPMGAAGLVDLSSDVSASPEHIAAGYSGAPGDNSLALNMLEIQNQRSLPDLSNPQVDTGSRYTLSESIHSFMGDIGLQARNHDQTLSQQRAIVDQLENYRQSISGVSLDEEAIRMIQFQTAFNAAAKTIKLGDELLETILSLK